jgi:hypothetical protein
MSATGLTQRRKVKEDDAPVTDTSAGYEQRDSTASHSSFKAENYKSNSQDLTLMEEIVLLGLKDSEVSI